MERGDQPELDVTMELGTDDIMKFQSMIGVLKETERPIPNRRPIPSRQVTVGFRISVAVDGRWSVTWVYSGLRGSGAEDRMWRVVLRCGKGDCGYGCSLR
eukprot:scaffold3253_cov90-Amphora_coffeaeformis.AAC.1